MLCELANGAIEANRLINKLPQLTICAVECSGLTIGIFRATWSNNKKIILIKYPFLRR